LLPKKTVFENIAFALEVAGIPDQEIKERVPKIIEIVGLTKRIKAMSEELSGGEKQRVAVARALINRPSVILADEPSGSLDSKNKIELHKLFFDLRDEFKQTFVISVFA
jgi:lipoprotein-releasing system ATP-binding protein